MGTTDNPKPATLRRRARQAALRAGKVQGARHGDAYWARNWGCDCLTCRSAVSKLNHEHYMARKAKRTEGE